MTPEVLNILIHSGKRKAWQEIWGMISLSNGIRKRPDYHTRGRFSTDTSNDDKKTTYKFCGYSALGCECWMLNSGYRPTTASPSTCRIKHSKTNESQHRLYLTIYIYSTTGDIYIYIYVHTYIPRNGLSQGRRSSNGGSTIGTGSSPRVGRDGLATVSYGYCSTRNTSCVTSGQRNGYLIIAYRKGRSIQKLILHINVGHPSHQWGGITWWGWWVHINNTSCPLA